LFAAGVFLTAVSEGLLGYPEMQIKGNGSYAGLLRWYQDQSGPELPQAWIISVPIYVYRLLMLAWALWLSFTILKLLKWGWRCFSHQGYWQPGPAGGLLQWRRSPAANPEANPEANSPPAAESSDKTLRP